MSRVSTTSAFEFDLANVPGAHRTYWFKCDHCDNLHVVLEDEDGVKIATMILDVDMLENMTEAIHGPPTAGPVQ